MRTDFTSLLAVGFATLLAGSIPAHAQTIQNGSFEDPAPPANPGYYLGAPTDFTLYNTAADPAVGGTNFESGTGTGTVSLFINSHDNPGEGIYQDLGALQPNTRYTLTYAATTGAYQTGNPVIENVSFYNGTSPTGTLLALASNTVNDPTSTFADYTLSYTTGATVAGDLTVLLANGSSATEGQAAYDNLRLAAVPDVPEPSTWAGGLIGASALAWFAFRRPSPAAA